MIFTIENARVVEQLREAAKQFPVLVDLFCELQHGLKVDTDGRLKSYQKAEHLDLVNSAMLASGFVHFDQVNSTFGPGNENAKG